MKRMLPALAMVLCLSPAPARATVGGATLIEMLGWDPPTGRVFFHELGAGEDEDGRLVFLALAGPDAGVLRLWPWHAGEQWQRGGRGPADLLDSLHARLKPLRPSVWQTLPIATEVVRADSVPNPCGRTDRRIVRVRFGGELCFEVVTWGSTLVSRPAAYEVPGRKEQVWVLTFVGDPFETGYETQMPVLVRPGERGTRHVEWRAGP